MLPADGWTRPCSLRAAAPPQQERRWLCIAAQHGQWHPEGDAPALRRWQQFGLVQVRCTPPSAQIQSDCGTPPSNTAGTNSRAMARATILHRQCRNRWTWCIGHPSADASAPNRVPMDASARKETVLFHPSSFVQSGQPKFLSGQRLGGNRKRHLRRPSATPPRIVAARTRSASSCRDIGSGG